MGTTISARRSQTRERLIEAAVGVFAAKGVVGATVEEICEAAGFTRGAFYSNFDSKDELCLAILEWSASRSLVATRQTIATLATADPVDPDALIDQAIWQFLAAQPPVGPWVMTDAELRLYAAREASLRRPYLDYLASATTVFADLIEQAAHAFGLELIVPARQAVDTLHAVYEHAALHALIAEAEHDPQELHAQLTAVMRSMLRPRASA